MYQKLFHLFIKNADDTQNPVVREKYGKLAGIGAATEKRGEAQLVTWEKTEKDAYI